MHFARIAATRDRFAFLAIILTVIFLSCGCKITRPTAGVTALSSTFNHTGVTGGCATCHDVGKPYAALPVAGFTHQPITSDCSSCHVTTSWLNAAAHSPVPASCVQCHGAGGSYKNDIPSGITNQMNHAFASLPDCAVCHAAAANAGGFQNWINETTTNGNSMTRTMAGIFHSTVSSGGLTTCQLCHSNERPVGPIGNPTFDHANGGTGDCVSCHTGTASNIGLTWVGGQAVPQYIPFPGFPISTPPAPTATTQTGITNLPHPTVGTISCTTCHLSTSYTPGTGYDHASTLIATKCNACHEAGSNNIKPLWDASTGTLGANNTGLGDSRPYTATVIVPTFNGNRVSVNAPNHFYPIDCNACHATPAGIVNGATTATTENSRWKFIHSQNTGKIPQSACNICHGPISK